MNNLSRIAFWLTAIPGILVGFFLARQEFNCGFNVPAFAICGGILLWMPWLWCLQSRLSLSIGRIVCITVGWGVWVLLGAAAGGGIWAWEIIAAAVIIGVYCGAVEIIAARSETSTSQKFGLSRWPFSIVSVVACAGLTVMSFCMHGLMAVSPWALIWITLWVSFRSIYCSTLLGGLVRPEISRQLAVQLQRGVLLLQGGILTGLIRSQTGALGFVAAMFLLSACNFLDKRSRN